MKNLICSLAIMLCALISKAQSTYPISTPIGGAVTKLTMPNYGAINGGFIPYAFNDSSSANTALIYGKSYNGFIFYNSGDSSLYFRANGGTKWVRIMPGGGTTFAGWVVGGNYSPMLTDGSNNAAFGTNDNIGIYFRTNLITRLLLDKTGILDNSGAAVKLLGYDTVTKKIVASGSASGAYWALNGQALGAVKSLGSTDNFGIKFLTNNIQSGYIDLVHQNTSLGVVSLFNNTTGTNNVAFGEGGLQSNTSGNSNSSFGYSALNFNTIGINNTGIGYGSLNVNMAGLGNTGVGYASGNSNSSGNHNTYIGDSTGLGVTTGSGNTFLGYGLIGYSSGLAGYLALGTNGTEKLGVNSAGALQFSIGGYGTAGYLIQSNGSGAPPTYVNPTSIVTATPTLQQVVAAGSLLTTDNTIDGGGNTQTFSNNKTINLTSVGNSNGNGIFLTANKRINFSTGLSIQQTVTNGSDITSDVIILEDSLLLRPQLGQINIDTLRSSSSTTRKNVMMWDSVGGGVYSVPISSVSPLSGSGTLNYLPKWTPSGTVLGNSQIYDDGSFVGIGVVPTFSNLQVKNLLTGGSYPLAFYNGSGNGAFFIQTGSASGFGGYGSGTNTTVLSADYVGDGGSYGKLAFAAGGLTRMTIDNSTGNVGIKNIAPAYPLDVTGTVNATDFRGTVGATSTNTGAFTTLSASTSATSPLLIGGTGTTSTLTYKTTTGVGATGANHYFLVGNNGADTALTILNNRINVFGSSSSVAAAVGRVQIIGDASNFIQILADKTKTYGLTYAVNGSNFNIYSDYYSGSTEPGLVFGTYSNSSNQMYLAPSGGIGIKTNSVAASAQLDITSTTKGFLPPRWTNTQMAAVSSPATGLIGYSTDALAAYAYNGTGYKSVGVVSGTYSSGAVVAQATFTVTFGGTQPNSTYKVDVAPTGVLSAALFYVNNKTTTTFDVVYLSGLTGTVTFDYAIFQ